MEGEYIKRTSTVEAIPYLNGEDLPAIEEFLGDLYVGQDMGTLRVKAHAGVIAVEPATMIVRLPNGDIKITAPEVFYRDYESV